MASVHLDRPVQFAATPAMVRTRVRANSTHAPLFMYFASLAAWSYDMVLAAHLLVG
jgi:hypothetical protein